MSFRQKTSRKYIIWCFFRLIINEPHLSNLLMKLLLKTLFDDLSWLHFNCIQFYVKNIFCLFEDWKNQGILENTCLYSFLKWEKQIQMLQSKCQLWNNTQHLKSKWKKDLLSFKIFKPTTIDQFCYKLPSHGTIFSFYWSFYLSFGELWWRLWSTITWRSWKSWRNQSIFLFCLTRY